MIYAQLMLSYANTQIIVLIFINFTEILAKIHKEFASLSSRPVLKPKKARFPELLEWAWPDPLLGARVCVPHLLAPRRAFLN